MTSATHDRSLVELSFLGMLSPGDAQRHPLYDSLCQQAGRDPGVIDMLMEVEPTQRRAVLWLAVLHEQALAHPDGPLGSLYPTAAYSHVLEHTGDPVAARRHAAQRPTGPSEAAAIVAWARDHSPQIVATMQTRKTQTNEVGRSSLLQLGLQVIGRGGPTALIDLGCSGGLNLVAPSYHHLRSDGMTLGDPTSNVRIPLELRTSGAPTDDVNLVWSAGIDLTPVDLDDRIAARWLLACQWPDDLDRFERTRAAIDAWRARSDRPLLVAGDLIEQLPDVVDAAPKDASLVIHHSWVASYLPTERQAALAAMIDDLRRTRPISWLYLEHPSDVPGLAPPQTTQPRISGASLLVLDQGDGDRRVLGQAHPHGRWIALDRDLR